MLVAVIVGRSGVEDEVKWEVNSTRPATALWGGAERLDEVGRARTQAGPSFYMAIRSSEPLDDKRRCIVTMQGVVRGTRASKAFVDVRHAKHRLYGPAGLETHHLSWHLWGESSG